MTVLRILAQKLLSQNSSQGSQSNDFAELFKQGKESMEVQYKLSQLEKEQVKFSKTLEEKSNGF